MHIKCWGSRGSIPVSGGEYLKYGGDSTCIEIRTSDNRIVIVDAGTGIRKLGKEMVKDGTLNCDIFFTHAHWDHIMGFPFFRPIYLEKAHVRIHSCPFGLNNFDEVLSRLMSPPHFPVAYGETRAEITYIQEGPKLSKIGGLSIEPVRTSHPNQGVGYKFTENGKSFVFITDNELEHIHEGGLPFDSYREFSEGADLLIHDAEYTEDEYRKYRTWGHSSFTSALKMALAANVKRFGLFHLFQDRNDDQMDEMVRQCREKAREVNPAMDCFAVGCGMAFNL